MPRAFYSVPSEILTRGSALIGLQAQPLFTTTAAPGGDFRQLAYFYTTIAFLCQITRSQTELQQLYYARRAAIRAQSEMIGSIYEKSLVRKDITGAVASDAASAAKSKKTGDGKEQAQDKAVQSADVGKIVSLIATDSPQIAQLVTFLTVSLLPTYASRFLMPIPIFLLRSVFMIFPSTSLDRFGFCTP